MSDITGDDIVSGLTEVEVCIIASLTPTQQDLFERFRLFLSDVLEGVAPEQLVEQARVAGWVFRDVAIEFGHDAADLTALGCAMFRAGDMVH